MDPKVLAKIVLCTRTSTFCFISVSFFAISVDFLYYPSLKWLLCQYLSIFIFLLLFLLLGHLRRVAFWGYKRLRGNTIRKVDNYIALWLLYSECTREALLKNSIRTGWWSEMANKTQREVKFTKRWHKTGERIELKLKSHSLSLS